MSPLSKRIFDLKTSSTEVNSGKALNHIIGYVHGFIITNPAVPLDIRKTLVEELERIINDCQKPVDISTL